MKRTQSNPRARVLGFFSFFLLGFIFVEAAPTPRGPIQPYPLKVCIVTDNELGSMGDERSFVFEGREIKICCKPCEKKFRKDPKRYLEKLEASAK